jgi:hypothetical protein
MPQVSMFRLYVLRAMYVFMFVGLALVKWPGILIPPPGLSNAGSVVGSVLGSISLLALLGPYPLKRRHFTYLAMASSRRRLCQSHRGRKPITFLGRLVAAGLNCRPMHTN